MPFQLSSRPGKTLTDRSVKNYVTYKSMVLFFALVDQFYELVLSKVPAYSDAVDGNASKPEWPARLSSWLRKNDEEIIKSCTKVLCTFQDDLLPCEALDEITDVCGLLQEIPDSASFVLEVLSMVP